MGIVIFFGTIYNRPLTITTTLNWSSFFFFLQIW